MIFNNEIVKRFVKNFSWLFLFNSLGYLFSFITFPILISKYGLEKVGELFTVQAIVLGLASVANYSFVYYIPTVSKQISENENHLIKLWNLVLHVRTTFSLFFALASTSIVYFFYSQYFMLWIFSLTLLIPKIINPTLFCNALEINKYVFRIGFFSKLFFLIIICVSNTSVLVNLFLALSELIAILLYLSKIHGGFYRIRSISFLEIGNFLKQSFNLFLVNFFSLLKPHSILPAISYVLGNNYVTLFAIAEKIINVIKGISGIVFVSFFPIYNKENAIRIIFSIKSIVLTPFLSAIAIVVLWSLSPSFIYYLNNFETNDLAIKALQILSLSIPMFFMIIPLFSYLLQHKKWNAILYFAVIQLVVLSISFISLIEQNIIGVAKSLVISEYALFLCYVIYVIKVRLEFDHKIKSK